MKIKVYFESNSHADLVATFYDGSMYNLCLPVLKREAKINRMIVTESVEEEGEINKTFAEVQHEKV